MYVPINCNRQQHIQQSSTLNGYIYIYICICINIEIIEGSSVTVP